MVQTLLIWIAVGTGVSGLAISILSFRPDVRLKKTQSDLNEQNILKGIIDELRKDADNNKEQLMEHGKKIAKLEETIAEMRTENGGLLKRIAVLVEAFRCRVLCTKKSCPVEDKFKELGGAL